MRTRIDASACDLSARPRNRQFRLRSLVLLPAVVATAAVMQTPVALALPGDLRLQGTSPGWQAVRRVVEVAQADEEVRPRRSSRRRAGVRRASQRQTRAQGRGRRRMVAVRPARGEPRTIRAGSRLAAAAAETVPLEQRSLVAIHPLSPDPIMRGPDRGFAADSLPGAEGAAPRCKSAHSNVFALAVAAFTRDYQPSEPAMVDGAWPHCRGARHPQTSWRLASLGAAPRPPGPSAAPLEPGWPIHWRASASCLAAPLRAVLNLVADEFGPLTVNSTCRSRQHNARVGGAPRSYHLTGDAVDFRVRSNYREVLAFLSRLRSVGGLTHYGSGVFHIDTGPRRTWGSRSWGRHRASRRHG